MEQTAKYAYEVYKQQSFSRAAKLLYISQPSLSIAVSRLEKDLGFQIFDRSKVPIQLTPQGRIYIDAVEEMLKIEQKMHHRLKSLPEQRSCLRIGGKSYTAYYLIAEISAAFQKQYPDVKLYLDLGDAEKLEAMANRIRSDELDVFFAYYKSNGLYSVPIYTERLIIAMHKNMPEAKPLHHLAVSWNELVSKSYTAEQEIDDLSIFSDVPFIGYDKFSPTDPLMSYMFGDYKEASCKIINFSHSVMHFQLMRSGGGALLVPDLHIVRNCSEAEDLLYFIPKSKDSYRTTYLNRFPTNIEDSLMDEFIRIAKEVCHSM